MKKLYLILIIVLTVFSLCSCRQEGSWTGDENSPTVVVIGDSILYGAETEERLVTTELSNKGYLVWVGAQVGLALKDGYASMYSAETRKEREPDILIIALGTNDTRMKDGEFVGVPLSMSRDAIHIWLEEVQDSCVRLIGPAESIYTWGSDITAPPFNQMLVQEASQHPNAEYVPWVPDPSWTENNTNPHLSSEGNEAYRNLILDAVNSCNT